MLIYDEYEDEYEDGIPNETSGGPIGLGLNREKDEVVEIRTPPYVLSPKTRYQGETFFLLIPVEEDDYVLMGTNLKSEIMFPETHSQEQGASFENFLEHSLHGSFGNQPDCEQEGLFLDQFSQYR